MSTTSRRRFAFPAAVIVAVVLSALLAACSPTTESANADVSDLDATELTDWLGLAAELVFRCESSVQPLDTALDAIGTLKDAPSYSLEAMLAAGQTATECEVDPDDTSMVETLDKLREMFPQATDLLQEWMATSKEAGRDALVVAADNFEARRVVAELYDGERKADEIAVQLTELVNKAANAADIQIGEGFTLVRWDPPDH